MVVDICVDAGCKDCWGVGFYWCRSVCVLVEVSVMEVCKAVWWLIPV